MTEAQVPPVLFPEREVSHAKRLPHIDRENPTQQSSLYVKQSYK